MQFQHGHEHHHHHHHHEAPFVWEPVSGHLPQNAVFASDNYAVIRANHDGDTVVGKYNLQQHQAYIPWGGKELPVNHNVEVLVAAPGSHIKWITASHGQVPDGTIGPIGNDGLYVGRAKCPHPEDQYNPGKIHPSHKVLYMPWGGAEQKYEHYEALVITQAGMY